MTEAERKRIKRLKAMVDTDDDEGTSHLKSSKTVIKQRDFLISLVVIISDDEQRLREELQDLIDDDPIEDGSDSETDSSLKRKKSDDRFEEEDYALIEENTGVKVKRVSSKMQILFGVVIALNDIAFY